MATIRLIVYAAVLTLLALYLLFFLGVRALGWRPYTRDRASRSRGKTMHPELVRAWSNASRQIMTHPQTQVSCPNCHEGRLAIHEGPKVGHPWRFERVIACTHCAMREYMTVYGSNEA